MATGTQVRRVLLQIQADEGDSEAKIDAIAAKADELSNKHPELAVKIETAAASAKLRVLRAELTAATKPIEPKVEPKASVPKAVEAGAKAAAGVDRGFRLHMSPRAAGWTSLITLGTAGLPAAAAVVGALAGAAFGAKLLIGTKAVQGPLYKQFHDLMATLTSVMRVAALPLIKPLAAAFAQIGTWAKQAEPLISRAFGAIGPLIGPLVAGLEGLVSGVLPGFITLMHAAAPAVSMVASLLGSLSQAAGGMLSGLAPAVRASSSVLGSLGQVVRAIAPVAAGLSASLATALAPALRSVAQVVTILAPVLSRAGALLAQLAGSALQVAGRALAAVLPYAARMVQVMANGLMPVLPPLITAVSQVAGVFTAQLARSLAVIMPAVEQLTQAALGLLQHVILPLLPNILQLTSDFSLLQLQAITPLIPPLLQLSSVLLQMADQVIVPAMPTIERLTGVLVQMANAALTAISLVSRAMSLFGVHAGGAGGASEGSGGHALETEASARNAGEAAGAAAGAVYGSAYGGAWADGATAAAPKAAQAKKPGKVTAKSLAQVLAAGTLADLTGTAAQVRAGVAKLVAAVTQDEKAGVVSRSEGSALTLWLDKDSARLQLLATKRSKILTEIAQAQKYAASVATSIRNADDLQTAAAGGWNGGPQTSSQIIANLRTDVVNIRKFAANIEKLRKMGLNRTYLAQLIQMGPDAGGQLAEQLADSGLGNIRQINAAESQIVQVSGYLGKTAANAMYDSGAMAGRGFLSGLEAQQAAITKMMQKIAKSMIDVLKHELGIHSPSTVTRDLARMTGAGIPLGLEDSLGSVRASAQRVARAMVPNPRGVAGAPGGAAAGVLQVEWVGGHQADQQFMTWLKKNIRFRGGDPGVTGR